jgi:hypothetical protein
MKKIHFAGAAFAALLSWPAAAQTITSKVYADDEFKIFISNGPGTAGVEFAQGAGYAINFVDTLALYAGRTSYELHIWVRDIGGGPTGVLGEFNISGPRGCHFGNGTTTLLTNTSDWQATKWLALGTPMTNGPIAPIVPYFNNVIPKYVQPSVAPASNGTNQVNPWPGHPYAGVPLNAQWIVAPGPGPSGNNREMWFSTRIACQSAN